MDGSSSNCSYTHGYNYGHNGDHNDDYNHRDGRDFGPDEGDIDGHLGGPNRFHFRRSVRSHPGMQHHHPTVDPVIGRFFGTIQDFQPPQLLNISKQRADEGRYGGPHIHHVIFIDSSGIASVTNFSGFGTGPFRPWSPGQDRYGDPFQALLSNVFRDVPPPAGGREAGGPTPVFARRLQDILNLLNPAHAIAGDAVYIQEALDQITTNLTEAHSPSNGAPPASTEALANLDRRPVDASMLEGDSETKCTICIEDLEVGNAAAFLPCKHWFHKDCLIMWLKKHNTCPLCRASIEKPEDRSTPNRHTSPPPISTQSSDFGSSHSDYLHGSGLNRTDPLPIPGAGPSRPPNQSQSRLNEVMRGLSSQQEQQGRGRERRLWGISGNHGGREPERDPRERERDRISGVTSAMSYDTSRTQRRNSRNSLSPPSPRLSSFANYRTRSRQPSPSQRSPHGRRRGKDSSSGNANAHPNQQTHSGMLSWPSELLQEGVSGGNSNRKQR